MMKRLTLLLWVAGLFILGLSSLHAQTGGPFLPSAADNRCRQWVDSVLSGLNVHEKVGQLIVATIPARADKATKKQMRELVKKYKVGGLLFSEGTPEEQAILTNMARKDAKIPVMVTFDGEWGLSMRLKGAPDYPRNAALGCIEDNGLIEEYGREVARQFRELGVHVNFAPDADVNTNPLNPVIHVRSFGENPQRVAEKVVAYSRGLESGGILSVCKHFPGHGDTDVDSHKALPALHYDRARLDSVELYPFKEMVRAGLGGVMVGHLQVQALDPDGVTPSSLSRNVVTGLLKDELGFKGLVFTDALDMKGVSAIPQVTTKALLAGNDMVLVQFNTKNAVQELVDAVESGQLSKDELDAKCRKVLMYKYMLGLRNRQPQLRVSGMSYRINTEEAQVLAAKLRCSAVTVLNNYFDVLPLAPVEGDIAVLSIGEKEADAPFVEAMKKNAGISHFHLPWNADEALWQDVQGQLAAFRRVVISITGSAYVSDRDVAFLEGLNLRAPLVYTFFTSYRTLQPLMPALAKSSAVVLAHSAETDLQQYVAALPVKKTDVYDIASLTKTTATLLAVMKLYDGGRLSLTDRVSTYLPFLQDTDKKNITVRELLMHESGLPSTLLFYQEAIDEESYTGTLFKARPDARHSARIGRQTWANPKFRFRQGLTSKVQTPEYTMQVSDSLWLNRSFKQEYLQKIVDTPLRDKRYRYSCVGFILLQQLVEARTGMSMDEYLAKEFYTPMGLERTGYLPLRFLKKEDIVPSSTAPFLRKTTLQGFVHDESAAFQGGVSGNAGLFSTAGEVAKVYQMLLNGGELDGKRYLSKETCRVFTTTVSRISRRGLGFDKPDRRNPQKSPCAESAPASVYGHTGFTGTCAWTDPENGLVYVFLSNRTYPDVWNNKLMRLDIRTRIQEAVYKAMLGGKK